MPENSSITAQDVRSAGQREALCAITRLRRELEEAFSGSTFLPPTRMDGKCVAGLQWHGRTVLAEGEDFVQAYHRLWRRAVRRFL
jgi:hypothetical protein